MKPERFKAITERYETLKIGVIGDFCLDRYLEIDTFIHETSIETGLPVYNVTRVRAQPGGAGTIVNNLVALDVGCIMPVTFCGDDGEGYELRRALEEKAGVSVDRVLKTSDRRTFTYCKPLLMSQDNPPEELNRLDSKNWTKTPERLEILIKEHLEQVAAEADALIFLVQVDMPETGVITQMILNAIGELALKYPEKPMIADSRQSLKNWPAVSFKMNASELAAMLDMTTEMSFEEISAAASDLAMSNGRPVFVSLSERGILAADSDGKVAHVPALPLRGPIDIVGAGDSVTAGLAAAMASGAGLYEALELAAAASSHVIHQLGTTGTASRSEIQELLKLDTL